jgi:hypothetical protein
MDQEEEVQEWFRLRNQWDAEAYEAAKRKAKLKG